MVQQHLSLRQLQPGAVALAQLFLFVIYTPFTMSSSMLHESRYCAIGPILLGTITSEL
jgi:hypothetical protein